MSATIIPFEGPGTALREPPNNIEAEQALLGAILIAPGALAAVSGWLTAEAFYAPVHGRIYAAAEALTSRGAVVNPVTLAHHFREDDDLSEVGGAGYLAKLAGAAVTVVNAPHYGRLILDLAVRRRVIEVANEAIEASFAAKPETDPASLAADAIAHLDGCLDMLASGDRRATSLAAAMDRSLARTEEAARAGTHITGVTSGLRDLDDLTGGLHPGELTILAARPGMGKTAMGLGIAKAAALAGHAVVFFTLEMPPEQLAQRLLASESGVPANAQRRGQVGVGEYERLKAAEAAQKALQLDLIDAAGRTTQWLAATVRRIHRRRKVGLVIVDYLGLVAPSEAAARRNRVDEVSEISAGLKRLSRELAVPVIALAQLNRGLEARENKRPRLSDLRDSGTIEQDADVVAFIYREIEYLRRERPDPANAAAYGDWERACMAVRDHAELIVEKQRQGPAGMIELRYDAERTTFYDALR